MGVEHPVDAGPRRIAGTYPGVDLGDELVAFADPPIQALAAQHADLDLNHVEPTGVLRCVVELQPSQEAVSLLRRKGLVQRASGVGREIVLHHPDPVGYRVVDIHEVAQAAGVVLCRALVGDRHLAPGAAIHEEVMAMPMTYNSLIGDMGSSLSGGQKQRVLLARALYREPKILFLDEGTAHLDVDNEKYINDSLKHLRMTRISVAHRPEISNGASRILRVGKIPKMAGQSELKAIPQE